MSKFIENIYIYIILDEESMYEQLVNQNTY